MTSPRTVAEWPATRAAKGAGARVVLAAASVAVLAAAVVVARAFGPDEGGTWLLFCGIGAVAAAVHSAAAEPKDLMAALLCSVPPVVALVAEGSPTWLIGPLGAALLLAAELNALSWECSGGVASGALVRRGAVRAVFLGIFGVAAALIVTGVGAVAPLRGTVAVALGAAGLAGLGTLVFGRGPLGGRTASPSSWEAPG